MAGQLWVLVDSGQFQANERKNRKKNQKLDLFSLQSMRLSKGASDVNSLARATYTPVTFFYLLKDWFAHNSNRL